MNYTNNFNLFGVEVRQRPCIKVSEKPTTATAEMVGELCLYENPEDLSNIVYVCVHEDGDYFWKQLEPRGELEALWDEKFDKSEIVVNYGEWFDTAGSEDWDTKVPSIGVFSDFVEGLGSTLSSDNIVNEINADEGYMWDNIPSVDAVKSYVNDKVAEGGGGGSLNGYTVANSFDDLVDASTQIPTVEFMDTNISGTIDTTFESMLIYSIDTYRSDDTIPTTKAVYNFVSGGFADKESFDECKLLVDEAYIFMGDLGRLNTANTDSLVGAINEVYNDVHKAPVNVIPNVLSADTEYKFGTQTNLNLNFPWECGDGDVICVRFISGETPTNLVVDMSNTTFMELIPEKNTWYEICAKYDDSICMWVLAYTEYSLDGE